MNKYFSKIFRGMERQAPGSEGTTRKVIKLLPFQRNEEITILDIACGNGIDTLILADIFPNAKIIAIDIEEESLEEFKVKIRNNKLEDRIKIIKMSLFRLIFPEKSFDLIWAESSIYITGFEIGLKDWKKFLKKDGILVCSQISWLNENISKESKEFWESSYEDIDSISNNIKIIDDLKYNYEFSYVLPKEDWIDNYYDDIEYNLNWIKDKYFANRKAMRIVRDIEREIELYKNNFNDYSYVFYGMKNTN